MSSRTITPKRSAAALAATCAAALLTVTPASAAPADLGSTINGNAVNRHLIAFQRIADQNGGNRASGQPGYEASVDYVAGKLRGAGFDVTTPEFTYQAYFLDSFSLAVAGQPVEGDVLEYSPATPQGGVTAPLAVAPVDDTPGCSASDYDGQDITGKVVLIKRGACTFGEKAKFAGERGAVGTIIYNNVDGALNGTLGDPDISKIPAAGVTKQVGEALAGQAGAEVKLDVQARLETVTTRNIVAQTRTGRTDNVVMAGAHLDSVPEGPGINDNGTGSAGLLEAALKLGGSPKVNNAVRFAFWGAEESGLVGSTQYVQGLSFEQQLDIALYLNFDMIGSPNAGYFVYDGDGSTGGPTGPHGSGQIEQDFVAAMAKQGVEVEGDEFDGRSDYGEFIAVGIPAGGLNTGVETLKTEEQAAKWGGTAGVAFDPNYHAPGDNLSNVDRVALERNAKALAAVVDGYSKSTEAVNGMQTRAERAQLRAARVSLMAQHDAPVMTKAGHHNLA
ncbi:Zn-dependent amino-or carboxypeptidase, M28 family [Saccharopolyspora shandongensis]|uniref:Zn-dependent amino-or carboxypeptidase, M28 family n=1 Tax=Saccharopolyspora shandongensis TaxID=418495 RepID=A0A1H2RUB2_9PSEU|nr:M28 family metallopeptidase [Saccharopolyspora shandongensis]SDW22344.1 Zn-dependent amino-or carboxypeptidase, M28 family [Saccharopolyspora shandongensis]